MAKTCRKYPQMPRRVRRHTPPNPFGRGGNPMPGMVKTIGQTTMGVVGIGAMTSLGLGAMNVIKPS